jgi:hypothetical protein
MEAVATVLAGNDERRKDTWFEKHAGKAVEFLLTTIAYCSIPVFLFMVPVLSVTHKLRRVLCGKRDDHTLTLLCDAHADA